MQGVDPATVVGRYIEECWNHGRLDLVDELVAADFIDHFPCDDGLPEGNDGAKAAIRLFRHAFPDLRLQIDDMIAEDDRVVVRFRLHGTHLGAFAGRLPTLSPVLIDGMVIHRVEHHQIIDQWCLVDIARFRQQLGVSEEAVAAARS